MKKPIIKTKQQIDNIREAGKYLTELLLICAEQSCSGIALLELEETADTFLHTNNLQGAFKGYNGFPANLCLSVNDCVVHGIPDQTVLKPGDLLKIDLGVTYQGGIADAAISLIVDGPEHNPEGQHLIQATKYGLDRALPFVKARQSAFDFASHIDTHITGQGCAILKNLTGHGVGVDVHEGPYIYNRPHPSTKKTMFVPGMVVALEPITAQSSTEFIEDPRIPRNIYTEQGDLGAQREYTVAIHEDSTEILAGVTKDLR